MFPHKGRSTATLSGNLVSRKTEVKAASPTKHQETPPFELLLLFGGLLGGFRLLLQRLAQDVAEARPGVGAAVLRDGLLLLGDLHRLDREVRLFRAVEARDH